MKKIMIGLAALVALITTGVGAGAVSAQDRGHHGGGGGGFERGGGGRERGGFQGGGFQSGGRGGFAPGGGERFGGPQGYGGRGYGGQGYDGPGYGAGVGRQDFRRPDFERGGGYPGGYGGQGGYASAPARIAPGYGGAPARGGGARGYTRGQFLPPSYLGGAVADPRQYHLRRPPNGYGWVTVGPNAYLTQRSTGLILDTAPLY